MIRINFLTLIRYPLAIWVLLYHLVDQTYLIWPKLPNVSKAIIETGKLAPSVFFVLSGFVITQSLASKPNIKHFYYRRFAYVFPIFIFTSTVMAINFELDRNDYFLNIIGFSPFLFSSNWFVLNGPAWSLIIEMWFYLLVPFIFRRMLRIQKPRIAILFVTIFQLLLPLLLNSVVDEKVAYNFIYHNPFYHSLNFFLGMMLYSSFMQQKQLNQYKIFTYKIISYVIFFVGLILTYILEVEVYKYGTLVIPGALALICTYSAEQKYRASSTFYKSLSRIGESAFAIYITQWLWIGIVREKINGITNLVEFAGNLIVIIVCITLAALVFDKYVLRLILNFSQFHRRSKGVALLILCLSLPALLFTSSKSTPYLTPETVKSIDSLNLSETKLLKQSDGSIIIQSKAENLSRSDVLINSCTFFAEKYSPETEKGRFVYFKLNVYGVIPSGETSWVESKIEKQNQIWKDVYTVYEGGPLRFKMVCN